jgi:multidrug resistance efflux pump
VSWKLITAGVALGAVVVTSLGIYWAFGHREAGLRLPGVVEVQEVRLGSKIGGRVAEVLCREGDLVKPPQVLVRFEAPEMEAQRLQQEAKVQQALADLEKARAGARPEEKDAARAAVDSAQARLDRLVAGWREEEKEQARNELKTAEADLQLAQREWRRTLQADFAASRAEVDTRRAAYDSAFSRASAARAKVDMLTRGSRPEDIAEARAELKKVEANLRLLEAGTRTEDILAAEARLAEAQAKLREIEVNLQEAVVKAPEPVIVEVLAVRKGDLVPANQPILRVHRADDLWVKVYVPEPELAKIRLNQPAYVTLDAWPDRRFEGVVRQIATESEFTPRNVQSADERKHQVFAVKVYVQQPEDPQGRIFKSGLAAEVLLPLQE